MIKTFIKGQWKVYYIEKSWKRNVISFDVLKVNKILILTSYRGLNS